MLPAVASFVEQEENLSGFWKAFVVLLLVASLEMS